ncbi:MAG: triose-phosphate isomerase [Bdellovibrio sp.]|nr:triose-phosphate isomerase [Bdellovibrio sp.]
MKPQGVLIAGNWKMNHTPKETEVFFEKLKIGIQSLDALAKASLDNEQIRVCVMPPMLCLQTALTKTKNMKVTIAAQNVHFEKKGAFTGEVSGPMLSELGINTVLIGHSERRQFFGETNETVTKKINSLLSQGFRIIVCIGETKAERQHQETESVLKKQLDAVMSYQALSQSQSLVIAYEPVWAIGTGLTATTKQVEEAHGFIRSVLTNKFANKSGNIAAQKISILYGGSVTVENFADLLHCENVDGGLIGGASLKPENMIEFIKIAARSSS